MPARALPDRPDLDQYRKQAKGLLRAWRGGDPEAIARITTHHPRLRSRGASPDAAFRLADAQLVIAREHGDDSWTAFAARIAAIADTRPVSPWKRAEDAVVRGDADSLAALLRDHGDALRVQRESTWSGGLAPSYPEREARAIIAREHFFASWDAFTAFAVRIAAIGGARPVSPRKLAEDAVVRGDAETLAALLRDHGDALRLQRESTSSGGLAPIDAEREARAIIAREHFFASWDAFTAFAAARRDPRAPIARFEAAADAIVGGDLETLVRLLREDPDLVRTRSARRHHATLFHYVGSNGVEGFRQRAPKNFVAIAAALLDAGADVNAAAQMYGERDTTLSLAATSIHPVDAGVLEPLLTFLFERGARVGDDSGAAWSALINACHANGRPAAAGFLAARAPALDLEAAAGLGRVDLVAASFEPDGRLKPPATEQQRNDGFMWACEYGRTEVVSLLLANGMAVGAKGRPNGQTGLHWTAWEAHVDTLQVLLDAGAPVDTRDDTYDGTALGWALYAWGGGGPHPGDARYHEIVRRLMAAGATVDQEWIGRNEGTPLGEALRRDARMRAALSLGPP